MSLCHLKYNLSKLYLGFSSNVSRCEIRAYGRGRKKGVVGIIAELSSFTYIRAYVSTCSCNRSDSCICVCTETETAFLMTFRSLTNLTAFVSSCKILPLERTLSVQSSISSRPDGISPPRALTWLASRQCNSGSAPQEIVSKLLQGRPDRTAVPTTTTTRSLHDVALSALSDWF